MADGASDGESIGVAAGSAGGIAGLSAGATGCGTEVVLSFGMPSNENMLIRHDN